MSKWIEFIRINTKWKYNKAYGGFYDPVYIKGAVLAAPEDLIGWWMRFMEEQKLDIILVIQDECFDIDDPSLISQILKTMDMKLTGEKNEKEN